MIGKIRINYIELDGVNLLNSKYRFYLNGLFDYTKTSYDSDLYGNGAFNAGNKIDPKQIVLNGYVKSNKFTDHMLLNSLLSSNSKRRLSVYIVGYGKLETDVIVSSVGTEDNNFRSCQLVAYDPYLYGEKNIVNLGKNIYQGIKTPLRFPFRINGTDFTDFTIVNYGTEILYPKITIKGPCSNFEIRNNTNGKAMYINKALNETDVLVIDNNPSTRSIKFNGFNIIDRKLGDWIDCLVGDNQLSFSYQSNSTEKLVTVEYRERFL